MTYSGNYRYFRIADFVADLRAPTPSAGAELAVPSTDELKSNLIKTKLRLSSLLKNFVKLKKSQLDSIKKRRVFVDYSTVLNEKKQNLANLSSSINELYQKMIFNKKTEISKVMTKLEALNPVSVIKRGFAYAKVNTRAIKSINDVKSGDIINITVADGDFNAKVE